MDHGNRGGSSVQSIVGVHTGAVAKVQIATAFAFSQAMHHGCKEYPVS